MKDINIALGFFHWISKIDIKVYIYIYIYIYVYKANGKQKYLYNLVTREGKRMHWLIGTDIFVKSFTIINVNRTIIIYKKSLHTIFV